MISATIICDIKALDAQGVLAEIKKAYPDNPLILKHITAQAWNSVAIFLSCHGRHNLTATEVINALTGEDTATKTEKLLQQAITTITRHELIFAFRKTRSDLSETTDTGQPAKPIEDWETTTILG